MSEIHVTYLGEHRGAGSKEDGNGKPPISMGKESGQKPDDEGGNGSTPEKGSSPKTGTDGSSSGSGGDTKADRVTGYVALMRSGVVDVLRRFKGWFTPRNAAVGVQQETRPNGSTVGQSPAGVVAAKSSFIKKILSSVLPIVVGVMLVTSFNVDGLFGSSVVTSNGTTVDVVSSFWLRDVVSNVVSFLGYSYFKDLIIPAVVIMGIVGLFWALSKLVKHRRYGEDLFGEGFKRFILFLFFALYSLSMFAPIVCATQDSKSKSLETTQQWDNARKIFPKTENSTKNTSLGNLTATNNSDLVNPEKRVQLLKDSNGDYRLYVNGKEFHIKGVTYAPTPVGESPDHGTLSDWTRADTNKNKKIDGPEEAFIDSNKK